MKTKNYTVTITPAIKTESGFISLICSTSVERHQIDAADFAEIETLRAELVKAYGYSCTASISLNRGQRKTPGFDKWRDTQPDVFNCTNIHPELEEEAAQAVA